MKTELILLAAGQSKRFGGIKQLADIQGQPMVCHCLSQFRNGDRWVEGIYQGYVVLGSSATLISEVLPNNLVKFVATHWQQGMGHTLAQSMQTIASDTSHVLVALADQVSVIQPMIMEMLAKSRAYPQNIIAAQYVGRLGAPCIFPKDYFSQLRQLTGDTGAKTLLQQNRQQVMSIEMPAAEFDIDTQDDLKRIHIK